MELEVKTSAGTKAASISVADALAQAKYNEALIHQVVTAYLAGGRSGNQAQKQKSEVRGGGAKPFKQKGTGRARAGSIRSPLWRGGGVVFAAKPRSYAQKVNKKMYRGAMRSIISQLIRQDRMQIMDSFDVAEPKTRLLQQQLQQWQMQNVLIINHETSANLILAARNLPYVDVLDVLEVNPVALIAYEKVIITVQALQKLEELLT